MPSPLADAFGNQVWATVRVLDAYAALDGRIFWIESTQRTDTETEPASA